MVRAAAPIGPAARPLRNSGWGPIPPGRTAVVVAHPDDETVGCGALLARLGGAPLVTVTDGAPRNLADAHSAGHAGAAAYAAARARELDAALDAGGVAETQVIPLGVPDQEATLQLASIARALALLLAQFGISAVLTHAYEGGHPDHDATAFAVHAARRLIGRAGRAPTIVEMPYYRLGVDGMVTQDFTEGGEVPAVLHLSADERRRKAAMIAAHRSQQRTLAAFGLEQEKFRRAPDYDFTVLPNGRRLLYEQHDWGMTGARWRDAARHALRELGLGARSAGLS